MLYQIAVYYTNSQDIRRFNADHIDKAMLIRERELKARFVRKVELWVILDSVARNTP